MADLDDFKKAVHDACQCFWTQDWPHLDNFLQDHVVMKRIDDPELFHSGKKNVMDYFHHNGQHDRARFEYFPNDSQKTKWQLVDDPNGAARIGVVSGSGNFWPTHAATKSRPIAFSFSFIKDNQKWLAILLWGAYTD
jgi:hypothetical protein